MLKSGSLFDDGVIGPVDVAVEVDRLWFLQVVELFQSCWFLTVLSQLTPGEVRHDPSANSVTLHIYHGPESVPAEKGTYI